MRWPWVSREMYDAALKQIEELKASNADLLKLALEKASQPRAEEEKPEPEPAYRPRRLVKEIRKIAEDEALKRFRATK